MALVACFAIQAWWEGGFLAVVCHPGNPSFTILGNVSWALAAYETSPEEGILLTRLSKMGYWGKVGSETYIPKMLLFSINDCGDAICGKLKWAGDQDITGVGVRVDVI